VKVRVRVQPLWLSLYACLMLSFFLAGICFSDFAWVGFFALPFAVNVLYGYLRKVTGEVFHTIALGFVAYVFLAVVTLGMLSTQEPFWSYLESLGGSGLYSEITTTEQALGTAGALWVGLLPIQFPWAILGVLLGIGAEKCVGIPITTKPITTKPTKTKHAQTLKRERAILHLIEMLLGKSRFSLPPIFSEFSDEHPFLAKIGYSIIIVALWAALFPFSSVLPEVFSQALWIAILLELGFIVVSVILSVGFFDLIQKDWDFMQIGIGFIIAILVVSFIYLFILHAVGLQ
jgi:hypothetical protein